MPSVFFSSLPSVELSRVFFSAFDKELVYPVSARLHSANPIALGLLTDSGSVALRWVRMRCDVVTRTPYISVLN